SHHPVASLPFLVSSSTTAGNVMKKKRRTTKKKNGDSVGHLYDEEEDFLYWYFPNDLLSLNEATHLISIYCHEKSPSDNIRFYYERNMIKAVETNQWRIMGSSSLLLSTASSSSSSS